MKGQKVNLKSRRLIIGSLLGLGAGVFVILLAFLFFLFYEQKGPFSYLDNTIYNYFYQSKEKALSRSFSREDLDGFSTTQPLTVITIDEATLSDPRFGRWPFPRSRYAELLETLKKAGAKTVVIDILFQEKSFPAEDLALEKALADSEGVILCGNFYASGGEIKFRPPLESLISSWSPEKRKRFIGYTYEEADPDGITRRIPLLIRTPGKTFYSLDLLAYCHFKGLSPRQAEYLKNQKIIKLGKLRVPASSKGTLINFFASDQQADLSLKEKPYFSSFSLKDVYAMTPREQKEYFRDRLVLLGVTANAGMDLKVSPLGRMSGLLIHTNLLLTLLEGKFSASLPVAVSLWIILLSALLLGLLLSGLSPRTGAALTAALMLLTLAGAYWLFIYRGEQFLLSETLFSQLTAFLALTVYQHHYETGAKLHFKKLVEEFAPLPQAFLDHYMARKGDRALREKINLSVLFSDIRGYTTMSESMDPMEVADMLNEFHQVMGEVFEANYGVVFTYIGDSQMVVFGLEDAKSPDKNHALLAVKAGLGMQEAMQKLNKKWLGEGRKTFEIGIGIASGEVSLGVVGGSQRRQYTVLGDTVNLAARLEGVSKVFQNTLNISLATYEACKECIEAQAAPPITLKGKTEPQQVYMVEGLKE